MTTMLIVNPSTASLYEASGVMTGAWVGFVFPEGVLGPQWGYFPVSSAWISRPDLPGYAGFFIFAPRAPANPAAFVSAVWNSPAAEGGVFQDLTIPMWVIDPDAVTLDLIYFPTALSSAPIIASDVNLGFGGNFSFLIRSNSYYSCNPNAETLTITAQQHFIFNINGFPVSGFDPSLSIALTGPQSGMLALNATFSFDPSPAGADLAMHYNYRTSHGISQIRYPLLDIDAVLWVAVTLDPVAPFDGARTRFTFHGATLDQPIKSGFTSPLGQAVTLAPLAGSALVIRQIYGSIIGTNSMASGFELDGPFALALDPPTPGGALAVMPGMAGSETMAAPAGLILNFAAGASFCPYDPTTVSSDATLPLVDLDGAAVTSWVSIQVDSGQATYASQPPQSAFYGADQSLASYLFINQTFPMVAGMSLPMVPFAAYALIASQLGSAVDVDGYEAFENHVALPTRQQTMTAAAKAVRSHSAAHNGPLRTFATGRGLVVSTNDNGRSFETVSQAMTVDSSGVTHQWSLTNVGRALSLALQSSSVFVVTNRMVANGVTLFNTMGEMAFADWQLGVTLDGAVPDQMIVLKFGPGSVATLAGQLGAWTDASTFLAVPVDVQKTLTSTIATILAKANGSDSDVAALYGPLAQMLTDPNWNGVLAFAPVVTVMPTVVQGIVSTLPSGSLTGVAMGIAINALSGGGATDPSIAASAPFAVIDYELAPFTTGGGDPIADFEVDFLRTRFQNGALASFAAQATLTINTLFGLPVALQKPSGGDATSNTIIIAGTYQNPIEARGQGTYCFAAAIPSTFRFAYEWYQGNAAAAILQTVTLNSIQFLPVSSDPPVTISRFAMSGSIAFYQPNTPGSPPGLIIGGDLFDYDALDFVNLGLMLTETAGGTPPAAWAFDVTQASLSTTTTPPRDGLACDLPLTLKSMAAPGALDQYSCQSVQVPTGWATPVASFDYALIYSLDLGRPGAFSPSSNDLTATLVLGWTANGSYALGFGIDGMGQQRQLTLHGIMQLTIGTVGIAPLPQGIRTRLGLILNQCQIGYLGAMFPPTATRFEVGLIGAPDYPSSRLLWFASSNQVIPPGSGA